MIVKSNLALWRSKLDLRAKASLVLLKKLFKLSLFKKLFKLKSSELVLTYGSGIQINNKISLATIYNTVHAFEKKGYLKQIPINSSQTYFDTNVTDHHHFYDLKDDKLIDLKNSDVGPINILKKINGKKIKSVEVLVKLED